MASTSKLCQLITLAMRSTKGKECFDVGDHLVVTPVEIST